MLPADILALIEFYAINDLPKDYEISDCQYKKLAMYLKELTGNDDIKLFRHIFTLEKSKQMYESFESGNKALTKYFKNLFLSESVEIEINKWFSIDESGLDDVKYIGVLNNEKFYLIGRSGNFDLIKHYKEVINDACREKFIQGALDYGKTKFLEDYEAHFNILIEPYVDNLCSKITNGKSLEYLLEKYNDATRWFFRTFSDSDNTIGINIMIDKKMINKKFIFANCYSYRQFIDVTEKFLSTLPKKELEYALRMIFTNSRRDLKVVEHLCKNYPVDEYYILNYAISTNKVLLLKTILTNRKIKLENLDKAYEEINYKIYFNSYNDYEQIYELIQDAILDY